MDITYEKIVLFITLIFSTSLIFTVFIIPFIHKIGIKFNLVDKPDFRKLHKGPIVRLGGVGIFLGYLLGLSIIYIFGNDLNLESEYIKLTILGSFLFLLIGLFDDLFSLSPFFRLGIQFLTTIILFSNGLKIDAIDLSWINSDFSPIILNKSLSLIFISLWVVGLTNAINWIDGLDALASGITLISTMSISFIFIALDKWELVFLSSAFCGGIFGFLRYNIFPAKIMMGDSGSYFLGSFLGIISIEGLTAGIDNLSKQINSNFYNIEIFPIHIALIIFFVPIFDMSFVIFTRIRNGNSPFYPDRSHIHHKLLNRGINERSTAIIIYATSILFSCLALFIFGIEGKVYFLTTSFIIILISMLYVLNMKRFLESNYNDK